MRRTIRRVTDDEGLAEGAALLQAGRLVVFPTETVYGLGADARSPSAIADLYAAKGRPRFNPLIAHVDSLDAALQQGVFGDEARALAMAFWPGPLTLVVPAATHGTVCALARAGLPSIAIRIPAHPVARALLERAACPVAAPSANRSGRISPTTADHAAADLDGAVDLILDGGATTIGVESTIVSCFTGAAVVLRPGGLTREAIGDALGRAVSDATDDGIVAPGMLASHYAPRAQVRLDAFSIEPGEAVLDFEARFASKNIAIRYELSASGDLREAASRLFEGLHQLDSSGATRIAVAPVPGYGLGEAINDRLRRAAAAR